MPEGIVFPHGMKKKPPKDDSIFMFYAPKLIEGDPNIVELKDIQNYFTGLIEEGNGGFVTGGDLYEKFEKETLAPLKGYPGHVAVFDDMGKLIPGGTLEQFKNELLKATTNK